MAKTKRGVDMEFKIKIMEMSDGYKLEFTKGEFVKRFMISDGVIFKALLMSYTRFLKGKE